MSAAATKAIAQQLERHRLRAAHLRQQGSHVLISDEEQKLHLLVHEDAAGEVSGLRAQVRLGDQVVANLPVTEVTDPVELEGLGTYRDFQIDGLDGAKQLKVDLGKLDVHLVADDETFQTSVNLGYVVHEVLDGEEVAVRPIPAGERQGDRFVQLDGELRSHLEEVLGQRFDGTVSEHVVRAALLRAQQLTQTASYLSSLALSMGIARSAPAQPRPDARALAQVAKAAEDHGPLSRATLDWLEHAGMLPDELNLAWAEATLDDLPLDAPEEVAAQLRDLYVTLQDEAARAELEAEQDALMGLADVLGLEEDELAAPQTDVAQAAELDAGMAQFEQEVAYNAQVLEQGLSGLSVPSHTVQQLARAMAQALLPSDKPAIVIVAGPRHSAADRMFELASQMVSHRPVHVTASDLSDPAFSNLFGFVRGPNGAAPTQADAALAKSNLDASRMTAARHALVRFEGVSALGPAAAPEKRRALQLELFRQLELMRATGRTTAFSKEGGMSSERRTVPLGNTVFLIRWDAEPEALTALLQEDSALAVIAPKVVGTPALEPEAALTYLEQDLSFRLAQRTGLEARVTLSPTLRADLLRAYQALENEYALGRSPASGSVVGFERFADELFTALKGVATQTPLPAYEMDWSRRLTQGERSRAAAGERLRADRLFEARPPSANGERAPLLRYANGWQAVVAKADEADWLREQLGTVLAQRRDGAA